MTNVVNASRRGIVLTFTSAHTALAATAGELNVIFYHEELVGNLFPCSVNKAKQNIAPRNGFRGNFAISYAGAARSVAKPLTRSLPITHISRYNKIICATTNYFVIAISCLVHLIVPFFIPYAFFQFLNEMLHSRFTQTFGTSLAR